MYDIPVFDGFQDTWAYKTHPYFGEASGKDVINGFEPQVSGEDILPNICNSPHYQLRASHLFRSFLNPNTLHFKLLIFAGMNQNWRSGGNFKFYHQFIIVVVLLYTKLILQ